MEEGNDFENSPTGPTAGILARDLAAEDFRNAGFRRPSIPQTDEIVDHPHRLDRVFAHRRLGGEHQPVRAHLYRAHHIVDLGPRRRAVLNHAFKQVGGHENGDVPSPGGGDDPPLQEGDFLQRDTARQVASIDDKLVRMFDDLVEVA